MDAPPGGSLRVGDPLAEDEPLQRVLAEVLDAAMAITRSDFGNIQFPAKVIIRRPQEDYQIVLTVDKVTENIALSDDQFQIKIPEGTKIQNLE